MSALVALPTARSEAEQVAALMAGVQLSLSADDTAALLDFFRRNKFPLLSLRGGVESPEWVRAVGEQIDDCESQRAEFVLVRNAWAREGIDCIAIKSGGFYPPFPYTSDNLDILVRREDWPAAVSILEQLDYVWLTNTDESHKILFRKFRAGRSVSAIHLHAWVGWDANFHEDVIWERARVSEDDASVTVPSPEDVILIHAAHAFFENKRFTLFDLERLRRHWARGDLDWNYIESVAERRGWIDGLCFALATCAHIERSYFGRSSAPPQFVERWERRLREISVAGRYYRRLQRRAVALPFDVSFAFSKLLYERKLLGDRHEQPIARAANVIRTLAWGVKQKSRLNPQRSMLVAFSGIDGAGKSSHVRALSEALTTCDVTHRVVWTRPGCSRLYRALSAVARRILHQNHPGPGAAPALESGGFPHKVTRLAWAVANMIDMTLVYAWHVRRPLLFGTVVVCDRYATDAVIELRDRLPISDRLARRVVGLVRRLAPKPHLSFLLDADPRAARLRSDDGADADPAGSRRQAYLEYAARGALLVRDGAAPFERESDAIVLDVLRRYFRDSGTLLNALLLSNPGQLNDLRDLTQETQS